MCSSLFPHTLYCTYMYAHDCSCGIYINIVYVHTHYILYRLWVVDLMMIPSSTRKVSCDRKTRLCLTTVLHTVLAIFIDGTCIIYCCGKKYHDHPYIIRPARVKLIHHTCTLYNRVFILYSRWTYTYAYLSDIIMNCTIYEG